MDTELILEPPDGDDQSKASAGVDGASTALDRRRGRGRDRSEAVMVLPSFIWDYFVKDASGKFVICTLCPAQTTRFAYSGGTSTMNRHLRKKHHKYAPGKCAADYEYPRAVHRRAHHSVAASPAPLPAVVASSGGLGLLMSADPPAMAENVSPSDSLDKQRHQLLELRTARRRAANAGIASKRRKLLTEPPEPTTSGSTAGKGPGTEFDPSGFVTLPGSSSTALQFPAGFELPDAMEMGIGFDQRFFDYASLPLPSSSGPRGRRQSSSMPSTGPAALNSTNQKLLTHRLLKYLIAQYEPLDVTPMGTELSTLLFGGSTEWPPTNLTFGYGGTASGYGVNRHVAKLPSEETLKLALATLYCSQREILKDVMADVDVLSLSLNNWTSAFGQNVLTVSGHWISRGFRRRDCVLEVYVLPLDERVNTIALLRDVLEKWDIPASKVAALTMRPHALTTPLTAGNDDCPVPQSAAQAEAEVEARAIHGEYPGLALVQCFVAELDAAMSCGLHQCATLTRRCRNYVSYFIQNPSEYQIFLALQRRMGEEAAEADAPAMTPSLAATANGARVSVSETDRTALGTALERTKEGLTEDATSRHDSTFPSSTPRGRDGGGLPRDSLPVICDVDDRWNSTTQMLGRIVELEAMLRRYKARLDRDTRAARRPMQLRFECCELSAAEWRSVKQLARLLAPIEGLVHVSPLAYPGLSIMYPLLHSVSNHLARATAWVTDPLAATVCQTIGQRLNRHLCLPGEAPSSPYLACFFDPRFKSVPFLSAIETDELVQIVYALLGVSEKTDDATRPVQGVPTGPAPISGGPAKPTATLLHEFFPLVEPATELETVRTQVQQYLDSPSVPVTEESEHDPLEWWSRYERLFPSLARLAKKYLCISAVSTPFHEAFTSYGQLMREKKARLDIEVAAQVLFCRSVSRIPEVERIGV